MVAAVSDNPLDNSLDNLIDNLSGNSMDNSLGNPTLLDLGKINLSPQSLWLVLNPSLRSLASVTRRTFTPAEVQLIYNELGEP